MRTGVVMPIGAGRRENVLMSIQSLCAMTWHPDILILVFDGPIDDLSPNDFDTPFPIHIAEQPKHEPGMLQPRNLGVHRLERINEALGDDKIDTVWFLDSDIIVAPGALDAFNEAMGSQRRVLVGPYDWLPDGFREPAEDLRNDPRWPSFEEHNPMEAMVGDLSAGLACFSGNLVWPIEQFTRIGGFWNEIHHGRCEDGELGLRAVACGVPISMVSGARGWHLAHPRNDELAKERNRRDVPMLNLRHPWVLGMCKCQHKADEHPGGGGCTECDCQALDKIIELFVVEEDGKRFNARCPCGWEGNTAAIWEHQANCEVIR